MRRSREKGTEGGGLGAGKEEKGGWGEEEDERGGGGGEVGV